MSDLIDRQTAIKAIKDIIGTGASFKAWAILDAIMKMPTAQPERCKDCIEWDSDSEWCNRHGGTMQENDFCSRAERRTDG